MTRAGIEISRVVRAGALVLGMGCLLGLAGVAAAQPNILFIFSDDHATQAIGAYGSRINRTPNIDRIAAEGIRFDRCCVTNSICAPSRAVILTGEFSHRNGVFSNRERFDGTRVTFPKLLREAGYQTALVGKWHLKSDPTGFDWWMVLPGQGVYYNPVFRSPDGRVEYTGYVTDLITDLALDWLRHGRDPKRPFLLMCQHKAPHRNWQPGPAHLTSYDDVTVPEPPTLFDDYRGRARVARLQEMTVADHLTDRDLKLEAPSNLDEEQRARWDAAYEPKNRAFREAGLEGRERTHWQYQRYIKDYLRCVASVDDGVGRLLNYLDEAGLARDTVVVYSSDQGFFLGEHGWYDKRWMFEESFRMPFLVRWPDRIAAGSADDHLVQNLDFAPTFLELAGVTPPAFMQGTSLVPLLRGESPASWRTSAYYHYYELGVHSVAPHYGVATRRYKLIHYYRDGEWELFDLDQDPRELRSVFGDPAYADAVKELKGELARLQERCGETDPARSHPIAVQKEHREKAKGVKLREVVRLDRPDAEVPRRLDPSAKPFVVGARFTPDSPERVLVALGRKLRGFTLRVHGGRPAFEVRSLGDTLRVEGPQALPTGKSVHLAGQLDREGRLRLHVDGVEVASAPGHFIDERPGGRLRVGTDAADSSGEEKTSQDPRRPPVTDVRLYWGVLGGEALGAWVRGDD